MASPDISEKAAPTFAELPLWKSFWVGQLGAAFFGFVVALLLDFSRGAAALNMSDSMTEIVGWAIFVPFYIMLMVSLWKCAYNTEHAIWGHLARVYAVLSSLFFVAILITVLMD